MFICLFLVFFICLNFDPFKKVLRVKSEKLHKIHSYIFNKFPRFYNFVSRPHIPKSVIQPMHQFALVSGVVSTAVIYEVPGLLCLRNVWLLGRLL